MLNQVYTPSSFLPLKYALCLAKERSFSKAAQTLLISQSALSQQIGRLEQEIGVCLFDRSIKPIGLTPEGEIFIREVESIFKSLDNLWKTINEFSNTKQGQITLGITPVRSIHVLPEILPKFSKAYPRIKVSCIEARSKELENLLLQDLIDIAILPSPIESFKISYEHLYYERICLFFNKNFNVEMGQDLIELLNKKECPPLILTNPQTKFRHFIDNILKLYGILPKTIIEVGDFLTALSLVKNKMGVTFAPDLVYKTRMYSQDVIPMYLDKSLFSREIVIAYKTKIKVNKNVCNFKTAIKAPIQD